MKLDSTTREKLAGWRRRAPHATLLLAAVLAIVMKITSPIPETGTPAHPATPPFPTPRVQIAQALARLRPEQRLIAMRAALEATDSAGAWTERERRRDVLENCLTFADDLLKFQIRNLLRAVAGSLDAVTEARDEPAMEGLYADLTALSRINGGLEERGAALDLELRPAFPPDRHPLAVDPGWPGEAVSLVFLGSTPGSALLPGRRSRQTLLVEGGRGHLLLWKRTDTLMPGASHELAIQRVRRASGGKTDEYVHERSLDLRPTAPGEQVFLQVGVERLTPGQSLTFALSTGEGGWSPPLVMRGQSGGEFEPWHSVPASWLREAARVRMSYEDIGLEPRDRHCEIHHVSLFYLRPGAR